MRKSKFMGAMLSIMTFFSSFGICGGVRAEEAKNAEDNASQAVKSEEEKKDVKDLELVFIIDKSGSMYFLTEDTIGNFNSVIDKQKKEDIEGEVNVTTVLFNHEHKKIHDRKNLKEIEPMTSKDYQASGCTALMDAVGDTITEFENNKDTKDHKFMFVIITDGLENSSKEFNREKVKAMIDKKQKENDWKFVFLGANIDVAQESHSIGIGAKFARPFVANAEGIRDAYESISYAITSTRNNKDFDISKVEAEKNDGGIGTGVRTDRHLNARGMQIANVCATVPFCHHCRVC